MISRGPERATLNQAFGNSVQMLEAVRFIFDQAGNRPCVCNLSLGTNGGPHDGTSLVEQGLDALVREKDNRAVVIAASNSQTDNIHTSGKVPKDAPLDIVFRQQSGGGGEFELWYSGQRSLQVSLIAQDGTTFGPVQPGDNLPIGANGQIAIFISSRVNDPNNHDNVIGIWVAEGLSGDDFTVRLTSLDGKDADFHAWIERNDRTQASFLIRFQRIRWDQYRLDARRSFSAHTTLTKAVCRCQISRVVDPPATDAKSPKFQRRAMPWSRRNLGREMRVVRKSGTSMAAPAVTGLIALIFGEAQRKGQSLSITALRQKLLTHAAINPPAGPAGTWDPRYGQGRANGASIP